jgi:HCOMODA/2-hydroxy-3-carboxy-muconic semialdehyde decarboxylase
MISMLPRGLASLLALVPARMVKKVLTSAGLPDDAIPYHGTVRCRKGRQTPIGAPCRSASHRGTQLWALGAAALSFALAMTADPAYAQTSSGQTPASAGPVDRALIDDLVVANHILYDQGVLDGFGHVSIRHPGNPSRFLMSRSLAPALVSADDIMEYDLDGNPVDARGRASFLERFIHAEVYRARPDVNSVIHSHSPAVIPFGVTQVPLRPLFHMPSFLSPNVPIFEIRRAGGMTNMLVGNSQLGKALAGTLGDRPVVLMRGHGNVVVAPMLSLAVFRAIYTEVNARIETQAITLGGPITFLEPEEAEKTTQTINQVHLRAWELWKRDALAKRAK